MLVRRFTAILICGVLAACSGALPGAITPRAASPDGSTLSSRSAGTVSYVYPLFRNIHAVALGRNGDMYVGLSGAKKYGVVKISSQGSLNDLHTGLTDVLGLAYYRIFDRLYAASGSDGKLYKIWSNGYKKAIGGEFRHPSAVTVNPETGDVYAVDSKDHFLEKISDPTVDDDPQWTIISRDFAQPSGVALDSKGRVYVLDSGYGKLSRVADDGTLTTIAKDFRGAVGLGSSGDTFFVGESGTSSVKKVELNGTVTTLGVGFNIDTPVGIAVDAGGSVFVASSGENQLLKFNGYGLQEPIFTPRGVAVDRNGEHVFVSDKNSNAIVEVNTSDDLAPLAGIADTPEGIALNGRGDLYVAEHKLDQVAKIVQGRAVSITDTRLLAPCAVAADRNEVYVASCNGIGNIKKIAADGSATKLPLPLSLPAGVAVDPTTGDVYASDAGGRDIRGHAVKRMDVNGNVSTIGAGFRSPRGLAVDPATGTVYVADYDANEVKSIDRQGVVKRVFGATHPTAVTVDARGTVYAADEFNVIKYKPQ